MEDAADSSLLAIYTETGVNQLIEAAEGKASVDLQLLECGWSSARTRRLPAKHFWVPGTGSADANQTGSMRSCEVSR